MKTELTSKRWTYQEMLAQLLAESRYELRDAHLYELRDAHLIEMPSPKPKHQRAVFRLSKMLDAFVQKLRLGEVFLSPLDVVFRKGDVVQPDLIFVAKENQGIIGEQCIAGAPDLLVMAVF